MYTDVIWWGGKNGIVVNHDSNDLMRKTKVKCLLVCVRSYMYVI